MSLRRVAIMAAATCTMLLAGAAAVRAADAPAAAVDMPADLPTPTLFCPDEAFAQGTSQRSRAPLPAQVVTAPSAADMQKDIEIVTDDVNVTRDNLRASGRVEIRQGDRRVVADNVNVEDGNTQNPSIAIEGNVRYSDPQMSVTGTAGHYREGEAQFRGAEFELPQQPARGSADALAVNRSGIVQLDGVTYTTCPPGRTDWRIRAKRITLDTRQQSGVGHGAQVEFKGVPIVYLPWISFPLGEARKSGFLFPSIGNSSRGGLQLSVPYYFNLAPNYDLLVTPTAYSRRGIDGAAGLRYLTRDSHGFLNGNFLPNDSVRGGDRSRIKIGSTTLLPGEWRLSLDAENVSDANYFEDFSQGTEGTSIAFLRRLAQLSYRDDHLNAGAQVRNYQTLDQQLDPLDRPYTELPRLYADAWWRMDPATAGLETSLWNAFAVDYGFDTELVNFSRSIGATGWRLDAQPGVVARMERPGYFVRPGLALRHTQFELDDDVPAGIDRSSQRTLPVASVDAGMLFEREAGSRGSRRVTLEPRLLYLYVPYRNQDRLPVFDSGVPDLNLVELFRTNRYVGADRVGDANQLSLGVTSRLYSSNSGARYLSATLGQTFYFQTPRVLLPDEVQRERQSSDIIAQLELKAFEDWSVDFGLQWDHEMSRAEKSEVRLQYRPANDSVMNVGYRFQRDRLEQAEFSGAWPVAKSWNLYGKAVYSLRDHKSIEEFAGVEYSSCCWGVRAVARHYVSARTGERDTGIYVQLELKGLSNVGLAADAFLERAIRGYSPRASSRRID